MNGHLVDSRVEANEFVSSDWTTYTVYLMLPGDWSLARVFTWVFDVESMTVEDDGSSQGLKNYLYKSVLLRYHKKFSLSP